MMGQQVTQRRTRGSLGLVVSGALVFCMAVSGVAAPLGSNTTVTVKGTFEWNAKKGQQHDLTGTLTPDGKGKWDVSWDFTWGGKPVVYKGVVRGDIDTGKVSGTGDDSARKRQFTFEGTAKDGVWTFTCSETTKGAAVAVGNGSVTVVGKAKDSTPAKSLLPPRPPAVPPAVPKPRPPVAPGAAPGVAKPGVGVAP